MSDRPADHLPKLIAEKAKALEAAGVDTAAGEVELILCHLLELDRLHLYLHGTNLLTDDHLERLDRILERRAERYPLQYILGETWFYGRRFAVNESVMVPTPETELLCESALVFLSTRKLAQPKLLDIGVGSGVIAVTMACELPACRVTAADISSDALEVARENAEAHGVSDRIELRRSDMFYNVRDDERFDVILSNPPYIAEGDYPDLMPEVQADPKIAMTSGPDGMDHIAQLLKEAPRYLASDGRIMFEIGYNQSDNVAAITEKDDRYTSISIVKDYNDIPRIIILACGGQS